MKLKVGDTVICEEDGFHPEQKLFIIGRFDDGISDVFIIAERFDVKSEYPMQNPKTKSKKFNIQTRSQYLNKKFRPRLILIERKK